LSVSAVLSENERILLAALQEMGGQGTVREINAFLWRSENQVRFQRHGRAWSERKVQHDIFYAKDKGYVMMERLPGQVYRYHLIQQVIH
jgi:hypothetical protein